jgi:lipid-A-disaccharide synthase
MSPLFYLIAGEPSGDLLGGRLMAGLKERLGPNVRFAGIGGEMMREQGLDSLFPMAELSIMGLAEVLPRLPRILRRLRQTVADIEARQPVALITIDSSGFNGRVQRRLKAAGSVIPRLHYVAPMVWAWREGRARHLGERVDLLMCLLPNEPAYFTGHGCKALHVGHPVIESGAGQGDGAGFRARHGLAEASPLLCLLPGSRHNETGRLLPVFRDTIRRLAGRYPGLRVVVPTVETVAEEVTAAVRQWDAPTLVVRGAAERYDAFAACDAALAASGTVALELALAGLPNLITYKLSPLTALAARRLIKLKYVNLVNILMDQPVVPELLLEDCRPDRLADAVGSLLDDPALRAGQRAGMAEAMRRLGLGQDRPSLRAADAVLTAIGLRPTEN